MIEDANDIESGRILNCHLCIIGAGVAGIALALEFEYGRQRVLILESGGFTQDRATQALYDGCLADASVHPPLQRYRRRVFGGSSTLWGGRSAPLDRIDFQERDWMPEGAWPIGYDDVLPYYTAASEICETGAFAYTAQAAMPRGMRQTLPGFRGKRFTDQAIERFSCPTNFARRYGQRLRAADNIVVLLHANAVKLVTGQDGGNVASVQVATLRGGRFTVRPRCVVLAAGGLETPRLLFASRDQHAQGIGNANDQLGRCYMTHLAGTVGEVTLAEGGKSAFNGYEMADEGVYCRRRFALTEAAQRELKVGNFIARLHHPHIPDPRHRTGPLSAVYLAKPFIEPEYTARLHGVRPASMARLLAHLRNVLFDLPEVARFARQMLLRRRLVTRKFPSVVVQPRTGRYSLDFHAEQAPNPDSRVSITREQDALGMPRLSVDWRASAIDYRTVRLSIGALADDFAESGAARLRYDADELVDSIDRNGAYGGHHIGTTRMSRSAREGVVDTDCRVHGVRNLYVAGSGVFPTSGQANPTLTIVALALRLASTLKREAFA
jgi:choline dehydrogenase-like flavoprotein